jgi:hypothetical protein
MENPIPSIVRAEDRREPSRTVSAGSETYEEVSDQCAQEQRRQYPHRDVRALAHQPLGGLRRLLKIEHIDANTFDGRANASSGSRSRFRLGRIVAEIVRHLK